MTDQNLERLGSKRVYQRGVGDDSQDIAEDFKRWKGSGLWPSLKQAICEVEQEGGFSGPTKTPGQDAQEQISNASPQQQLVVFFGQDEEAGCAKQICDLVTAQMKEKGFAIPVVQSLADRKAVEAVKKLSKNAVALVVADASPAGVCAAGRKLVRTMSLELDANALAEKFPQFAVLLVANTVLCNADIEKGVEPFAKAFDRIGAKPALSGSNACVHAPENGHVAQTTDFCHGLAKALASAAPAAGTAASQSAKVVPMHILTSGAEAKEAGEALLPCLPGGQVTLDDASLQALNAAAAQRVGVILAIECAADGGLSDSARGFAAQLNAAPLAIKTKWRQIKFGMLSIAATDYGNAGERASANASRAELTQAVAPVLQALSKAGATCVASLSLDLQDADQNALSKICSTFQEAFSSGTPVKVMQTVATAPAPAAAGPKGAGAVTSGPQLCTASSAAELPSEVEGEPADVLARFYFEAEKVKVLGLRQLRQCPSVDEGLSTMEVELEASRSLQEYQVGGTLSLLPENDPADVAAMLPILGLTPADLAKFITFSPAAGDSKVKRPFPTPCTLGEALSRYCDLSRAPTKKMLTSLQSRLKDVAACERLAKIAANGDALKMLGSSSLCCRMAEFWTLLGIGGIEPGDFLLHCPRQKAREFTIASSPVASPGSITLCVSLTSHERSEWGPFIQCLQDCGALPGSAQAHASPARFFGACSYWLSKRLQVGSQVLAKQRQSALHLPGKDVPIIMVGAGAGVAPFRGFWEELRRGSQTAPAALFFGCRHPEKDWIYKNEMSAAVKLAASGCSALARMQVGPKRPLTCLFTAFSKPGDGKESLYVQQQIKTQGKSVKHWIENMSGAVYICGSTGMGNGVLDVLAELLDGGRDAVESLRQEGRIVAEMWG